MKVKFKSIAKAACIGEGGAKQVDIAQASDILKAAFDYLNARHTLAEIVSFFEESSGRKLLAALGGQSVSVQRVRQRRKKKAVKRGKKR